MDTKPYVPQADGLRLTIHLTPGAGRDRLDRIDHTADGICRLRASVTAPPEKGKANAALAKLLSKKLRLPKSAIQIIAGAHSREKVLLLAGDPDRLAERLSELLSSEGILDA